MSYGVIFWCYGRHHALRFHTLNTWEKVRKENLNNDDQEGKFRCWEMMKHFLREPTKEPYTGCHMIHTAQTMLAIMLSHVLHCVFFWKWGNLILCYMFILADGKKGLTLCQHIAGNRKKRIKNRQKNTFKWPSGLFLFRVCSSRCN